MQRVDPRPVDPPQGQKDQAQGGQQQDGQQWGMPTGFTPTGSQPHTQSFEEIYGVPENFLEIEVRNAFKPDMTPA